MNQKMGIKIMVPTETVSLDGIKEVAKTYNQKVLPAKVYAVDQDGNPVTIGAAANLVVRDDCLFCDIVEIPDRYFQYLDGKDVKTKATDVYTSLTSLNSEDMIGNGKIKYLRCVTLDVTISEPTINIAFNLQSRPDPVNNFSEKKSMKSQSSNELRVAFKKVYDENYSSIGNFGAWYFGELHRKGFSRDRIIEILSENPQDLVEAGITRPDQGETDDQDVVTFAENLPDDKKTALRNVRARAEKYFADGRIGGFIFGELSVAGWPREQIIGCLTPNERREAGLSGA
jgi:hypothetical protein